MQGRQGSQRVLFDTIDLERLIPADHLLRRIDARIDFDFIYELTQGLYCADNGRNSIDPVLFFRMQLISYLYGMKSDRELCREVHLNLAYRWFCRLGLHDAVPEHSSMTRIRDRFGQATFTRIFERLIAHWHEQGRIRGRRIVADASLVEADAAIDSMVQRDDADPDARALKNYERRYHDFKTGKRRRKLANQTHVSISDPDASLVSRPGAHKKLSYKAHFSADAHSRMITDCHASTGSRHECAILPERIEYQRDDLGLPIEEVIADRGYGRGPTYAQLREHKIRHYIPLHDPNTGRGKLTPSDFAYERGKDRYRCPEGHYLYPYDKSERGSVRRYRITGGHCRHCPMSSTCLPDSQKFRARFVYRGIHQDEVEAVRRRQSTAAFRQRLVERKWKIEGLFGEAKQNHGLRRARYRGLSKVQIQFFMIAIALNCKRVVTMSYLVRLILVLLRQLSLRHKCSPGELDHQPCLTLTPA
jgi:transposase